MIEKFPSLLDMFGEGLIPEPTGWAERPFGELQDSASSSHDLLLVTPLLGYVYFRVIFF